LLKTEHEHPDRVAITGRKLSRWG